MTSEHPPNRPEDERDLATSEHAGMPQWVPIAIGVVLITMAALAVVTGLRYRDQTLTHIVQPHQRAVVPNGPAPPGEPEPGASLMFPGDASNVPAARATDPSAAHAQISGGPGGVSTVLKFSARRGLRTNVTPSDAVVYINDVAVGQASQFDSQDEEYDFAAPGSYSIRVAAPGYKERLFVVTAEENAKAEVAVLDVKLEKM